MNEMEKRLLKFSMPVDPRMIKEQQGYRYVPGDYVLDKLNELCPEGWNFDIVDFGFVDEVREGNKTVVAYAVGKLTTPLGSRTAMGTAVLSGKKTLASNADAFIKGAGTDALKKAATMFGIAAELYPERDISRRAVGKPDVKLSKTQRVFIRELCAMHGAMEDTDIDALLDSRTSIEKAEEITVDNYNGVVYALIDSLPGD